jgi:hypothetical protein
MEWSGLLAELAYLGRIRFMGCLCEFGYVCRDLSGEYADMGITKKKKKKKDGDGDGRYI